MSIALRRLSARPFLRGLILPVLMLLFSGGCYSSPAMVVMRTVGPPARSIGVTFGHACFSTSATGEDQIILIRQPIDDGIVEKPGTPLTRQTSPALNQLLRIQLLWRTAPAGSSDSAVADNAVLHWYVYGDPGDGSLSVVTYVGTGAVSFSISGSEAKVAIHNAVLRASSTVGELTDPFGSFRISGRFKAIADPDEVRQTIDDIDKATVQASAPK